VTLDDPISGHKFRLKTKTKAESSIGYPDVGSRNPDYRLDLLVEIGCGAHTTPEDLPWVFFVP
jgi:hypothetical protein